MSGLERINHSPADPAFFPTAPDDDKPIAAPADARTVASRPDKVPPVQPAETTPAPERASRSRKGLRMSLFAALPIVLAAGGYWYVAGGQVMSTDDAYIAADKVGISTDVSGTVQDVDVAENEHVSAGQTLYRLDPRQFQIALDHAKATLANTRLSIDNLKASYRMMLSNIASQQAVVDDDQATFGRFQSLVKDQLAITKAQFDQARYTLDADKQKLASLDQQAKAQLALLGGRPDSPTDQHPQYLQAKADVEEAERQLDHAVVQAPFAGVVTGVPSIAPGTHLPASTTAFFLVATDHVWVDSQPKETQLTYVRPGQPVRVTVDTYPDVIWEGTVESISPAASAEFSLLPAQNTSGNWVKVVQRIPMRVRVETSGKDLPQLRTGMSAEVDVDTGHARGLPLFLAALFNSKDRGA
jgi:membrane fusion protein (multidrug efflux system)